MEVHCTLYVLLQNLQSTVTNISNNDNSNNNGYGKQKQNSKGVKINWEFPAMSFILDERIQRQQ